MGSCISEENRITNLCDHELPKYSQLGINPTLSWAPNLDYIYVGILTSLILCRYRLYIHIFCDIMYSMVKLCPTNDALLQLSYTFGSYNLSAPFPMGIPESLGEGI